MRKSFYELHNVTDAAKPYIYHPIHWGCVAHWHENIEILRFAGAGEVVCGRTKYHVCSGDMVLISSNVLHAVNAHGGDGYECLIVDSKFLAHSGLNMSGRQFECVNEDADAVRLFEAARGAILSDEPYAATEAKAAILLLAVYLCRNYSHPAEAGHEHRDAVKQAIGYIQTNFARPISIDELAAFVKMSKYYFCREFRRETGYTVVHYINNLRCREAERMLRSGGCTVGEAAHFCGFENLSYFTRTFKSVTGMRPIDVRNNA